MKAKRTSRLVAFLLTVTMLLPLITIPSFGAETQASGAGEYLYENTFETYTEGHVWNSTDSYFEINPNNKLSSSGSKHMVIEDPENSADLVWKFPMESANNRNHLYLATDGFSYATTPEIIFEFDFYVPADAYGSFFFELRTAKYTTGSGNPSVFAIKMGTSSSTQETVVLEDRQDSANYKQHVVHREQWYHISYAWDMVNGTYRTSLDGELVFSGKRYTSSSIQFTNTTFADINLYSYDTYCGQWGGNLLLDDIRISDSGEKFFPVWENTLESAELNSAANTSAGFSKDYSAFHADYKIVADPFDSANGNQVMQMPLSKYCDNNLPGVDGAATEITFENDIFIPLSAIGKVRINTWTSTLKYHTWYDINFSNASESAIIQPNTGILTTKTVGNLKFERGVWNKLTLSTNRVTGEVRLLINGELALIATTATSNFNLNEPVYYYYGQTLDTSSAHHIYYDDFRIYGNYFNKGEEGDYRSSSVVYENTYQSAALGSFDNVSSLGYSVAEDPENSANMVMLVPVTDGAADNYNAATKEFTTPSDYTQASQLTFKEDIYIPSAAVGIAKIQGWERYSADSNVWNDFFYINFTTVNTAATLEFPSGYEYTVKGENLKLNRDTWYSLTVSLNQITGGYTVLIDGEIVFAGNFGTPVNIAQFFVARMKKAADCGADLNGSVYIDNVRVIKNYYDAGKETSARTYKWSNDFEPYTVDALITDTSAASGFNSSLPTTYKCTTVYNPYSPYDKVMDVPTANGNNYIGQTYDWRNQGDSYTTMKTLVFEQDIYLPAATTGKTRVQGWQKIPVEGFKSFYDIDFSTANEVATVTPIGTTSYTNGLSLKRDTWHTVTFSLVQSTGDYYLLIDGNVAAIGNLGVTSLQICTYFFFRCYAGASGSVYLDDMHIYQGFDKGIMLDTALYRNTFETYENGFAWSSSDTYFANNPNKPITDGTLQHTVVADPADSANLAWQIPLTKTNLDNNSVYLSSASAVDYESTPLVTLSMDLYVPTGAKGDVKMQGHSDATGFNDLYHVLMKGTSASVWVDDTVAYTGDLNLSLDTWHTVDYSLNLATGEFKLMIDGNIAYTGNIGLTNRVWSGWIIAKLQSTSRVSDYAGTLLIDNLVIDPLLTDGEMAKTSYLYENHMEQYWSGHVLEGDAYFNANINDGDHGHMIVTDPANASNKAWKISMGSENANNPNSALKVGNNVLSYTSTPHIVFETDLYVPTGTTGTFLMEAWSRDRTDAFQYFYQVDITSASAEITPYGEYSYAGDNLELERDTWYKISFALDMVTGGYTLYVDGVVAATGITGQTNLLVSNDAFMIAKVESSRVGNGHVLVDDILIYRGEVPMSTVLGEAVTEDFADLEDGVYIPVAGNADTLDHSVYSYTVHSSIVLEVEYYIGTGSDGILESKFDSYRYLNANIWGIGGELSLYSIDLENGRIYQKDNANIYGTLTLGETNKINVVLDLATGKYSVYVNGIGAFNAEVGNANLTFGATADQYWQFATVASDAIAGDVTVDNLCMRLLETDDLIFIDVDTEKTLQYVDLTLGDLSARTGVASLFLPADTAFTATAVYFDAEPYKNVITTEQKVSVRLKADSGLRFATKINDKALFDSLFGMKGTEIADVYFSTLITPVDYLEQVDGVFTKDALDTLLGVNTGNVTYLDIKGSYGYYIAEGTLDDDPATTHFVGSIVNIKKGNYNRSFAAIGYVEITLLTGEVITLYSAQSHSANIKSTATTVRNAGDGYYDSLSAEYKAVIDTFADYMPPVVEVTEDNVPALSTSGSQTGTYTTEKEGTYTVYSGVSDAEVAAYKSALTENGFTLYTTNTLDGNTFATYTGNTHSVRLFQYPNQTENFRILVSELDVLPDAIAPSYTAIEGLAPTVTQPERNGVKQGSTGESYVIQFEDGSFAIIDGGPRDEEDAYELLNFLYANKPAGDAKPRITWFLTHAHDDHVTLALDFMEAYRDLIELETLAYNFPDFDGEFTATNEGNTYAIDYQQRLDSILSKYYPNTEEYVFQTGDKLYLPGCTVDFLHTYLDLYTGTAFAGINETSAVFKMTFEGGYSFLVTGDMYPVNCNWLLTSYTEALQADIVQTPHHGRDGATAEFYDALLESMKILLWSNSASFLEARSGSANDAYDWSHNAAVLASETIKHYHASVTVIINMKDLYVTVVE